MEQQHSTFQLQSEITKHLCQAHAVQIKGLQNSLGDIINQTTKALDEGQPELAQALWKQVVQQTQNISRLFNQTNSIMYSTPAMPSNGQYGFPQGRRYTGQSNGRHRRNNSNPAAKQLSRLTRKVDELVAATAG